jgi:hypothetical protein
MTPLVSALLAATWLAFVFVCFWGGRQLQIARRSNGAVRVRAK